jgi:hypothetical protein
MKKIPFFLAALLLAACGGGGKDHAAPVAVQQPPPPSPVQVDPFVTSLAAIVHLASDDAEPGSVDTLAATMPDDSEPEPVGP